MALVNEPRIIFIGLMLIFPVIALVNALVFGRELRQFSRRMVMFSSYDDIMYFQKVVAHQMYAALFQIVLLATPAVLYVVGAVRGYLEATDLVFVILPSIVIIALGMSMKKVELRVRRIPARDEDLEQQRDAIVTTWVKKPLPDW